MWLRRPMHTGCTAPCPYVHLVCVPVLIFHAGLLAVPRQRYLERGTLFFTARDACPELFRDGENKLAKARQPDIKYRLAKERERLQKEIANVVA